MNTCAHYQEQLLHQLYGLLETDESRALEQHLAACPPCREAQAKAEAHKQLIGSAARAEFAGVRFEPPAAVPLSSRRKNLPMKRAVGSSRRWLVAACIGLFVLGGLSFGGWLLKGRSHENQLAQAKSTHQRLVQDEKTLVAEQQAKLNTAQSEWQKADADRQQLFGKQQERINKAFEEVRSRQQYMVITGPRTIQPGAPNDYIIETKNLNNALVKSDLEARVKDRSGKLLYETMTVAKAGKEEGRYKLTLPRDLPVRPDTELVLEVVAKDDAGGARGKLAEAISLAKTLHVTHLTTDKPMYQPGETVHFRSLTLDRFSLKPTNDDFLLLYQISDPNGQVLFNAQGASRVTDEQGREIFGPDGKPIKGIGAGQWAIPPALNGGEYTLAVSDNQNRFPAEKRKFIINRYEKPRLNKQLDFGKSSYGPGDEVFAVAKAQKSEGGLPLIGQPVSATINIDGKQYDAQGKETGGPALNLRTDAAASVGVRFKLPATIEKGEATLAVQFTDGGSHETIVRPIPIVLKKLNVEFFPEGGDLAAGVPNRVYFQVKNTIGKPADLKGKIVGSDGKTAVAEVLTLNDPHQPGVNQGMGVFQITPVAGIKYELKIESPAGIEGQYLLPAVKNDGVALSIPAGVTSEKEPIHVVLHSAGKDRNLLVGAYCRGRLLDHRRVAVKKDQGTEIRLQPDGGIGGVYRVTVFEERATQTGPDLTPVAERLVYRQAAGRLNLTIKPDKTSYVPGDQVKLNLSATDEKGQAAPAILMVAVVDKSVLNLADEKTHRSMPTHFFLTSEVKKPEDLEHADFLVSSHPLAFKALDLLLGTQGWRRFAEQDPAKFKNLHKEDAERMLVSIGQISQPVQQNAYEQAQRKVFDEFKPQFQSVQERQEAAALRYEQAANDEQYAERYHKLHDKIGAAHAAWINSVDRLAAHENFSRGFRERGLLILSGLLLLIGICSLVIGLARSLQRGVPYLAAGVVSMALCGVILLGGFWQVNAPRMSSTVAMATRELKRLDEAAAQRPMDALAAPVPDALADEKAEGGPGKGGGRGEAKKAERDGRGFPPPMAPALPGMVNAPKPRGAEMPQGQFGRAPLEERAKQLAAGLPAGKGAKHDAALRRAADADGLANRARKEKGEMELANGRQLRFLQQREQLDRNNLAGGPGFRADKDDALAHAARFVVREYAHQRIAGDDPKVRVDFTETLYWHPVLVLPKGENQVSFQLCDSVTSFQVTAYGHTSDSRLGAVTSVIESRKPFTLEPKIPIEVTANDRIDIPVTIANDSDSPRYVSIDIERDKLNLLSSSVNSRLSLDPNQRKRQVFSFQPSIREGDATLTLKGTSEPFAIDEVKRVLRVVPEGFPVVASKSDLLEGVALNEVTLPRDIVKGTLKVKVEVYLSTLADLQKGLEGLLREPNGCFEQTSTSNYPNLLILGYLKESNQSRPEVEQRAQQLLDRGYAKLTSFECRNTGKSLREGYEWFGGTAPPHEALTAYGLLQFRDMAGVYKVDQQMVERTRQYLMSRRDGKGGFLRNARALDTFGRAPDNITNAYIVWAITESGKDDDLANELSRLHDTALGSKDPYFLALVANSLINRERSEDAAELLKKLVAAQKKEGFLAGAETSITRSGGRTLEIETTSLAILAWLKSNRPEFAPHVQAAVTWLGKQRGGHGAFGSTQSTILALKALIAFAKDNKRVPEGGTLTMKIGPKDAEKEVAQLKFDKDVKDSLVLELKDPEKFLEAGKKNEVLLELSGKNKFPYTLTWTYSTLTPLSAEKAPVALTAKLDRAKANEGDTVRLTAKVENQSGKAQGMTMAIIGLPAGLTIPEDMKQLKEMARLRDNDTKPGLISAWETRGRELILYWRDLGPDQKIEVSLDLICRVPGEYRGPASRAYLYYNADTKHWVEPLKIEIAAK